MTGRASDVGRRTQKPNTLHTAWHNILSTALRTPKKSGKNAGVHSAVSVRRATCDVRPIPSNYRQLLAAFAAVALSACSSAPQHYGNHYIDNEVPYEYLAPAPQNGSIYQSGYERAFFEDIKAHRVGDTITVLLTEQTSAEKSSATSLDRTNSTTITGPTILGSTPGVNSRYNLGADLDSQHDFSGQGSSNQSNSLSGSVTVTVARVLPNGNLVIRGEKWIEINQGQEFVRIQGMVRPVDVSSDNVVLSTKVADARISYSGKGQMADTNRMGWLAKFFLGPLWPF
ncbi:MAG: flagellar basal body L-ring protein FlgH [Porticoccaceae bacterium]|nr:flagellar basal body L-ring protein FlgH [Porticoccaceae bacterium]